MPLLINWSKRAPFLRPRLPLISALTLASLFTSTQLAIITSSARTGKTPMLDRASLQLVTAVEPINVAVGESSLITDLDVSRVNSLDELVASGTGVFRLTGSRRAPEIVAQAGATDALALRYEHVPPKLAPGIRPLPSLGTADHYILAFPSSGASRQSLEQVSGFYESQGFRRAVFAPIRNRRGQLVGHLANGFDQPNRRSFFAWTNGPLLFLSDGDASAASALTGLPYGVFEFIRTGPRSAIVNGRQCPPPPDQIALLRQAARSVSSEVSRAGHLGEAQGWLQLCARAGL